MAEKHQHTEVGLPDLRLPIGFFFIVIGAILSAEGALRHETRAGIPIDQLWGVVLFVFGVGMALFGYKAGPEVVTVDDDETSG
jgi:hypothetical protein